MTPNAPARLFPWVQGLRATAAFSVAFFHVGNDAVTAGWDPTGLIAALVRMLPWNAGVDVFFVISGFVIIHASAGLFGGARGAGHFLHRRLTRIVPLYWLLTTLFLATVAVQRNAVHGVIGGTDYILASYLFLPWPRPDGLIEPVLGLGWTLNYEMFFYLVLTPFLLLRRNMAVLGCAVVLCLFVGVNQVFQPALPQLRFWADPMILEFVAGMGLAVAVGSGLKLAGWMRFAMMGIAIAALHLDALGQGTWRAVSLGVPAALMVCAAVSGQTRTRLGPAIRIMIRLGDASYAMYLFHPFIMRAFGLLGSRITPSTEVSGIVYLSLSLAAAQLCALAINSLFERKMTRLLRRTSQSREAG